MGNFLSKREPGHIDQAAIELPQKEISFGKKCTIGPVYKEKFQIVNKANRRVHFRFEPVAPKGVVIHFEPTVGNLPAGKPFTITSTLQMNSLVNLDVKVSIEFDGGSFSQFIDISARCEAGVFGCDPLKLDLVEDLGHMVPKIIVDMRLKLEELNAKSAEGIFRLAGDVMDVQELKDRANASSSIDGAGVNDVHAYASLLKIWFRELPSPLLNSIPTDIIKNLEDKDKAIEACLNLPEPERTLLLWITDLLVYYVKYEGTTKMTAQNLAIVVAPNLYNPASPNPLESMMLLQKGVSFFCIFLQDRIEKFPNGVAKNDIIIEEHNEIDEDDNNNDDKKDKNNEKNEEKIEEKNEGKNEEINKSKENKKERKKERKNSEKKKKEKHEDDEEVQTNSPRGKSIDSEDIGIIENKKDKKAKRKKSENADNISISEGSENIILTSPKKKRKKKHTHEKEDFE